jgi:hypothetical protein
VLQLDIEKVIGGRVRVFIQKINSFFGLVHLGVRRLGLIAIVNPEVLLIAEHVNLLQHFPLEVRKGLVPYLELEGLLVEQLELDGQTLRKLLLCDVGQAWLKTRVAFFLLREDFILQDCHVVALVLFVHLGKEKRIHEAFIQLLDIFGLKRLQKMQKAVDELGRWIVVPCNDLQCAC